MTTPIRNMVKALFVHVDDLDKATEWYSTLLGQPILPERKGGPVYFFELEGGTHLILDSNVNNPKGALRPAAMFDTEDIDAAFSFLQAQGATILTEVQRYPDVCFFNFQDPQGNVAMVCQEVRG